jgi:peptide subunit release factor 1 (eRF1)
VRPFVAAIDEGRPAGIVVATRSGVRVLEWSLAGTRELAQLGFELTDAQLADSHGGPVAANPARGTTSTSHREAFEDRVEDNRHRFLKDAAGTVAALASERRWDRLVVAGGEKIRADLAVLLSDHRAEVVSAPDVAWESLTPGRIAQEAWPLLRSLHRAREADLWRQTQEVAGAGGAAVLGARRVCEAANVGRVDHLLFARDAEVEGHVAADGSLHESVGGHAAQAGLTMTRDPHLVERLVERVLAMGGEVTRVDDGAVMNAMAAHQGLAALLRW